MNRPPAAQESATGTGLRWGGGPLLAPGLGSTSGRAEELRALAVTLTRVMLLSPVMRSRRRAIIHP